VSELLGGDVRGRFGARLREIAVGSVRRVRGGLKGRTGECTLRRPDKQRASIMEHIDFPVLDESCSRVVTREVIEVEREGPSTVRLLHSPAFVTGIARGDLIELDPNRLSGFRILERGGMLAAVIAFPTERRRDDAERVLRHEVEALAGVCEGGPGRALVFSIPVRCGFPKIEAFLNEASQRFDGGWYFGNVHDGNGTPLAWWET
jgi:hypothetical protein